MDVMIEMLRAFEHRIWEAHRNQMPNLRLRQCATSFVVQYEFGDDDNIGSIFLRATKDGLCIKVFHGKDPDCETNIIYATPEIYIIPTAESMLKKIVAIIDDSAYEGYYSDIELIAQEIKKEFGNCQ